MGWDGGGMHELLYERRGHEGEGTALFGEFDMWVIAGYSKVF